MKKSLLFITTLIIACTHADVQSANQQAREFITRIPRQQRPALPLRGGRRRDLQQRRTPDDRRRDQGGPMKYLVTLGATPKTPRTKKKKNP
jgi:hypothetical protein